MKGLYAITDAALKGPHGLARQVAAAIAGGAQIIQYRDKSDDAEARQREAGEVLAVCRENRIPLIINDDIELALAVDADGVHLGRDDSDHASARERLGNGRLLGISCYNRLELAVEAARCGADYIAFGSFHPSDTKPGAVRATPDLLRKARARLGLPLVAIGGITPDNGSALIAAGADMLAVVRGVFAADDVKRAAAKFQSLFEQEGPR